MTRFTKKVIFLTFLFFAGMLNAFGQQNVSVAFFGISSPDADKNMLSMTEDLYYKQLSDMNLNLADRRSDTFSTDFENFKEKLFSDCPENFVFYIIIKKNNSEKWECSINLKNLEANKTNSITKEYDSYYKIIMDSKTNLKSSIETLFNERETFVEQTKKSTPTTIFSTENIAGTWNGEDMITKIVIMRGGRGFIVFKNGATMNINVTLTKSQDEQPQINIKQTSSNNASFFTELNRKLALESAVTAEPIEWNLAIQNDGTLKGFKTTLIEKNNNAELASIPVAWTKIN